MWNTHCIGVFPTYSGTVRVRSIVESHGATSHTTSLTVREGGACVGMSKYKNASLSHFARTHNTTAIQRILQYIVSRSWWMQCEHFHIGKAVFGILNFRLWVASSYGTSFVALSLVKPINIKRWPLDHAQGLRKHCPKHTQPPILQLKAETPSQGPAAT